MSLNLQIMYDEKCQIFLTIFYLHHIVSNELNAILQTKYIHFLF